MCCSYNNFSSHAFLHCGLILTQAEFYLQILIMLIVYNFLHTSDQVDLALIEVVSKLYLTHTEIKKSEPANAPGQMRALHTCLQMMALVF